GAGVVGGPLSPVRGPPPPVGRTLAGRADRDRPPPLRRGGGAGGAGLRRGPRGGSRRPPPRMPAPPPAPPPPGPRAGAAPRGPPRPPGGHDRDRRGLGGSPRPRKSGRRRGDREGRSRAALLAAQRLDGRPRGAAPDPGLGRGVGGPPAARRRV